MANRLPVVSLSLLAVGFLFTSAVARGEEQSAGPNATEPTPPAATADEEAVFSGPQVGETLPPLPARYVFDQHAGETFDPVAQAAGKPLVIIFVHEVTRPSAGVTRAVGEFAASRREAGLHTAVIFLGDDATQTEQTMKRARHALPSGVELGLSPDGVEGPGAYGLDRKMSLTVLVANEGKVTANFALVQPSLAVDAPKIAQAIVDLVGGEVPNFELAGGMRGGVSDDAFRELLSPLIQRDATDDEVDAAAKRIEAAGKRNPAIKLRVGETASRIVSAGVVENYGTPRAQDYLTLWAGEHDANQKEGSQPRRPQRAEESESPAKETPPDEKPAEG
jgi:hypothetical protein